MAAFPVVLMDIYRHLAKEDVDYYRESREQMFGSSLEDVSLTRIMPTHLSHICMIGTCENHLVQHHSLRALLCQVQFSADQPTKLKAFRAMLEPLRQTLHQFKFLGGDKLNYADIAVAGNFLVCTIEHVSCACLCCAPFRVISESLRPPHLYVAVDLVKSTLSTTAGHQHASTDFAVLCRLFFLSDHIAVMQMQNALLLSLVTSGCCTSCFRWIRCLCSG